MPCSSFLSVVPMLICGYARRIKRGPASHVRADARRLAEFKKGFAMNICLSAFTARQSCALAVAAFAFSFGSPVLAALPRVEFDLRVHGTGGKEATVTNTGDTVLLDLYATSYGVDSDPLNDVISSGMGSFGSSSGGLLGDLLGIQPPAPFNSPYELGSQVDGDGDGDLDIGTTATGSIGLYQFRTPPHPSAQPADGLWVGQVRFAAKTVTDATTQINFSERHFKSGVLAFFDNTGVATSWYDGLVTLGAPVVIRGTPVITDPTDYIDGVIATHTSISKPTAVTPGKTLSFTTGFDLVNTGSLSGGSATINDTTSGNFGGILQFGDVSIATIAAGTFTHAGGYSNLASVTLGSAAQTARLEITGGNIDLGAVSATRASSTIHQSGGVATLASLLANSDASAQVDGGTMIVNGRTDIGTAGSGALVVAGGDCTLNGQTFVGSAGGSGSIRVDGGSLTLKNVVGGIDPLHARIELTNGKLITTGFTVKSDVPSGKTNFSISGGTLQAGAFAVGNGFDATFDQTAGNIVASDSVGVFAATLTGRAARYNLSGGTVTTSFLHLGTDQNHSGSLFQSGGDVLTGDLIVSLNSAYHYTGGTLRATKSLNDQGVLDLGSAAVTVALDKNTFGNFTKGQILNATSATFTGGVGSIMNFAKGFDPFTQIGSIQTQGLIHIDGDPVTVPHANSLGGSGTIDGDVTNLGVISPGNSPGELDVVGNYTQASDATLSMEIAGTTGDKFDLVTVTGNASIGGTLDVALLDDFVPSAGDQFTIFTAGSVSGHFVNALDHIDFAGGRFDVNYSPTAITLSNFTAVPEPTGMTIVLSGSLLLARRRASRRAR